MDSHPKAMQTYAIAFACLLTAAVNASPGMATGVPLLTARYDDADKYLPKAEAANTTGQRLFLRQMATETAFDMPTPRNVVVKVIANQSATAKAGVVLLVGGDCGPFSTHSYFGIEHDVIHKTPE